MNRGFRLLLKVYPAWFRADFGDQLVQHWTAQRGELRYRGARGAMRYWTGLVVDGTRSGLALRAGGVVEAWVERRAGRARHIHGMGKGMTMEWLVRDLRQAVRGLWKNPGYAAVFIITLGLGIGANTAMFSAVNAVLLKPLPHEDGERLIYLRHQAPTVDIDNALFSVPEIEDYRSGSPSMAEVAEFSALTFTVLGLDNPLRVRTGIVTGNYFGVMGLGPALGRVVGPEDDGEQAPPVMVLSHAYWQRVFGGDPGAVGRVIEMNGRATTIVGVAEPAPPYPERTDVYVNMAASPHHLDASMNHDRVHRMTEVFARLAPGASVEAVEAEVDAITARIHAEYPEAYDAGSNFEVSVTPLKRQLTSRARPTLLLLLATASFVLIIACANLANLTLTRVLRRGHEMAVRVSLGAGRAALRRELLVESLVLGLMGAMLGLVIASISVDVLVTFAQRFTPRASEITLDASVFGFALLAAVGASVFFTLVPSLPSGESLGATLTQAGSRTTTASSGRRAQRALVVAQIATSFVLLIGAGLLLRTMGKLNRVDPGFEAAEVLAMNVPLVTAGKTPDQIRSWYLRTLDDLKAVPGVEAAALTSTIPLAGDGTFSTHMEMAVDGYDLPEGAPSPRADFRVVSADYFETLGIEIKSGRGFTTTDLEDSQPVVVINEAVARAYFGDRDPIGQRIAWTDDVFRFMGLSDDWRTVVGVVADTRHAGLDAEVLHAVYTPYHHVTPFFTGSVVMRLSRTSEEVLPAVRQAIVQYDPNQPIDNVATLADLGDESVAPVRLNALLLGGFAVLALVIATVGIGGVLAFSVGSRRKEFGVRAALGAARSQIWAGVLREGATLATAGVLLGVALAVLLTRFIEGWLYGVPALDPVTFVGVGLLLAGVAVLGAWIPALRAAEVSPIEALVAD